MRKAYFLFTLVFFFTVSGVLGQTYSGDGEGTQAVPYEVTTADQLNEVRDFPDAFFVQMNDISLDAYSNWQPIGDETNRFYGHYDGAGYTISDLKVDKEDYVGLFGHFGAIDQTYEDQTSIKNVVLENVKVTGTNYVGSLVGKVTGGPNTIIENCYVINGEISGNSFVGGLVGANNSGSSQIGTNLNPIIQASFANVSVEFIDISEGENSKIGGLVGCNKSGVIKNSYSASSITINTTSNVQAIGGLVGCMVNSGKIEYSYAYGYLDITATVTDIGGLLGNKEGAGTSVVNSYWDVEATGQSSSAGGNGKTTAELQKESTFIDWDFDDIWSILEDESYPYLQGIDVLSGFDVTGPSTIQAGAEFDLEITNASDVNGVILNGFYQVAVTTNIAGEPNSGTVFDNAVQFISGETTLANLILTITDDHDLSISVQSISDAEIHPIEVTPAPATGLFITQQPAAVISGSNDDQPANLGSIEIITLDQFGNPSAVGLNDVQNVTVAIENDGSPGSDAILGSETIDIQSGTALFSSLTLDKEGTGYTLKFTSNSPETLGEVITDPFDVVDIDDLSVFAVTADSPQYSGIEFNVTLTGAADNEGNLLNGDVNVTIDSNVATETFSFDGLVTFTEGQAIVPVTLNESDPAGLEHILTVSVAGITSDKTVAVTVFPDQSGFTIADPGQQYQGFAFDLELTGATWVDGSDVTGDVAVIITSSEDGELYNGLLTFTAGETATPITLTTLGDHTIIVSVDGITNDEDIVVNVAANVSGFVVAEITSSQTAGVEFNLVITDARNTANGLLDGSFAVTVTSNISGEPNEGVVFDGPVTFTSGAATFGITLTKAANPNQITIGIETILPTETLDIEVIAADAEKLAITQQPASVVEGNNDNSPAPLGTIIVEAWDAFDNLAFGNLASQQVTVTLQTDGSGDGALLDGTLSVDIIDGIATFSDLTLDKEGTGYVLRFTSSSPVDLGSVDTDPFEVTGIENLSGFDIVDPGPQVINTNYNMLLENAKNTNGLLLDGLWNVKVQVFGGFVTLIDQELPFIDGSTSIPLTALSNTGTVSHTIIVDPVTNSQSIDITFVSTDDSNITIALVPDQDPTAGEAFDVAVTALDKAGNPLVGEHFITLSSDNTEEGTGGILFEGNANFVNGDHTLNAVTLFKAGLQNLSVETSWVTDPGTLAVTVIPNVVDTLVITQQPTGGSGTGDDTASPISSTDVILQFQDAWGNASADGLDTNEQLTVSLENDASLGGDATLSGTLSLSIVAEQSDYTFSDLTLDKDGEGYTIRFAYGDPELYWVISDLFNMTNINTYGISLDADDPLVFADEQVGYSPVAAEVITITRVGQGDIMGLTVSLDEVVENSYEITQPDPGDLINSTNTTTFTVKPADGLAVGLYEATVTVTANAGLDSEQVEQFDVSFRVLEAFAIELDADDPLVFPNISETYNNEELEQTITITNTGFGEITGLTAALSGDDPGSFIISVPDPTSITTDNTSTFTIKPDVNLTVGTYTATVSVNNTQLVEESFGVQITVVNEFVWEGDESDRWNTAGNWSENEVPGENDFIRIPSVRAQDPFIYDLDVTVNDLIIEEGAILRVRSTRDLTIKEGGKLTIRPGGKMTAAGNIFNQAGVDGLLLQSNSTATGSLIINNSGVEATVERWINSVSPIQFHIVSSPVSEQSFSSFFSDNSSLIAYNSTQQYYAMQEYIEETGWSAFFPATKPGNLEPGRGYSLGLTQNGVVRFKGTLRHNDFSTTITQLNFGWNDLGNPFAASISTADFLSENSDQLNSGWAAIYIFDPGTDGYLAINNSTSGAYNLAEISSSQGFIIKAKEGGGTANVNAGMRQHANPAYYKNNENAPWYHINMKATDAYQTSMTTFMGFRSDMTTGLDVTYDAGQYSTNPDFSLFTRMIDDATDINMAVQALPDHGLNDVNIPVGLVYPQGGEVTFTAESVNLPAYITLMLYDSEEGAYTDLSEESYTTIIAAGSEPLGRFFLNVKTQIMHLIHFDTLNEGGEITASIDGETIEPGNLIPQGSDVTFSVSLFENYEIDEWIVNGEPLADVTATEILIEDLMDDLEVLVSFKETSTQIEEVIADDNLIIYIFENRIVISGEVEENTHAVLYDMLGRRMRVEDLEPGAYNEMIIDGLKPGGYFIHILNNKSQTIRKLLIH